MSTAVLGMGGHVCDANGSYSSFKTVNEPWELECPEIPHPYVASAFFALRGLGDGRGRKCLTVGSTVFEARMLRGWRWDVTMLDVRKPPVNDMNWIVGDAISIPFPDDYFDALSSTCCLCHVGLGRYGDAVLDNGDLRALHEFSRVLKKSSAASIMFGPCVPSAKKTVTISAVHRSYALKDVEAMATEAGFQIDTAGLWCSVDRRWLDPSDVAVRRGMSDDQPSCYLSMLLEKK